MGSVARAEAAFLSELYSLGGLAAIGDDGGMMSLRRFFAVVHKELRHITRDPRTFFLVTISPAVLLFMLAYVFAFDVTHVVLGVMDLDRSALSRRYVAALTSDGELEVRSYVSNYEEAEDALLRGEMDAVLVIPPEFEEGAYSGSPARVQAIVDGADPIVGGGTLSSLASRTNAFALILLPRGGSAPAAGLDIRSRAWYNPDLKSLISMVPGLMAVVLCMPALAVALALAREKEVGSFEALIATPLSRAEYLAGKLVPYVLSGLVSVELAWLVAVSWFRVPFRGDFPLFLLLAVDYLVASMGLSMLIASFAPNQQTTLLTVLMIFFVPSFFLSGLILPVNKETLWTLLAAYTLPPTHFVVIARGLFLKGLGLAELWPPALSLGGIGGLTLALSLLFTRKRVA
ncbi:MAG TPA: ABC transporter permease [Anaerolineae bacterium]|nr:ABC transporter permease [Anaerolineae bacterium]